MKEEQLEVSELKNYLTLATNTLPLNFKIAEVKNLVSEGSSIPLIKSIEVTKLNTENYIVYPFHKTVSKIYAYDVPRK